MNTRPQIPRRRERSGGIAILSRFSLLLLSTLALFPGMAPPVRAHCDTLDGPVAAEAKAALENGNVTTVLKWVGPDKEPAIRDAFDRTRKARAAGPAARDLADLWFLETLVRLHREGEGAPYTGLKPAGGPVAPGIAAADQALEKGSSEELIKTLAGELAQGIRDRFARTVEKRKVSGKSVEAGREYVAAYVDFIHYVEAVDAAATASGAHPGSPGDPHREARPGSGSEAPPAHEH